MVVKVAKTGYDANSATDDQLVFNSAQNVFKIVDKVTLSYSGASVSTQSVPHGLNYTPAFMGFSVDSAAPANYYPIPSSASGTTGIYADATNVYVTFNGLSRLLTATVYLLQETAN